MLFNKWKYRLMCIFAEGVCAMFILCEIGNCLILETETESLKVLGSRHHSDLSHVSVSFFSIRQDILCL